MNENNRKNLDQKKTNDEDADADALLATLKYDDKKKVIEKNKELTKQTHKIDLLVKELKERQTIIETHEQAFRSYKEQVQKIIEEEREKQERSSKKAAETISTLTDRISELQTHINVLEEDLDVWNQLYRDM